MNKAATHLKAALTEALKSLGVESPRVILEKPRDASHGDIACNAAMVHGKELKKNPKQFAEDLLDALKLDSKIIAGKSAAGPGFLNFLLAKDYLQSVAREALVNQSAFGESQELSDKKIIIEFVSANPTGPLNVVSARAAAVGDTLCRLFRARGAKCFGEFYVNDTGNQVRLLGESVRARYETELGNPLEIPEGGYHGEYLVEYAKELIRDHQSKFQSMSADSVAPLLGQMAVERHVGMHKRVLGKFGVHFDNWYHESKLKEDKAEYQVLDQLHARNVTYQKDGAEYLRTSEYGDGQDWVVITSDGRPTYFLPDIAYHLTKFNRGFDHVIDILGPDHHSFTAKMKAALRALGLDAEKLEVIILQHVTLLRDGEPVKMSKRAGQLIEMEELLEEAGVDAARYFFLLRKTSTPLDFDIELAKKKSDENPVFYVQYAHARIESIFRKSGLSYPTADADLTFLTAQEELDLLRRIHELEAVMRETTESRDPHALTTWLRELAAQFHRFYHNCRVLTEPHELQTARLALCRATQIALQKGLTLCGVSAPSEM